VTIAHRLSTIKDANCIFVMGDGLVLEQGTHSELLKDENGPYSRLVQSQKLRERQTSHDSDSDTAGDGDEDMIKAEEDVPLGRKNTEHSLASDIIEQKRQEGRTAEHNNKDHSLSYLFMRMGKINSEDWRQYLLGTIFAISKRFFFAGVYET
jgi:ATP-binding cassette, subfamily B (MDR/TAP), member 1